MSESKDKKDEFYSEEDLSFLKDFDPDAAIVEAYGADYLASMNSSKRNNGSNASVPSSTATSNNVMNNNQSSQQTNSLSSPNKYNPYQKRPLVTIGYQTNPKADYNVEFPPKSSSNISTQTQKRSNPYASSPSSKKSNTGSGPTIPQLTLSSPHNPYNQKVSSIDNHSIATTAQTTNQSIALFSSSSSSTPLSPIKTTFPIPTNQVDGISTNTITTTTTTSSSNNPITEEDKPYIQTLQKYFGYTNFRPGQLDIIKSILNQKDAAVFWSTGSGKSLCYQIPPLHTHKVAVIVSPLISLMEDQVSKLNNLVSTSTTTTTTNTHNRGHHNDIAVFLGSGQANPRAEQMAMDGEYLFIYCTPEKLVGSGGGGGNDYFLNGLSRLHSSHSIGLIAIDESHCVSEWGHDFRPQYRSIGQTLRSHPVLKQIPILALTATAVPRVQTDILSNLQLRNPTVNKQTFDRPNLVINVKRKPQGGYSSALRPFVEEIKAKVKTEQQKQVSNRSGITSKIGSTIIYCPTQNTVHHVCIWLQNQLDDTNIQVQQYHAGLSLPERSNAHVNFLTGNTAIIVATIAFGMGIDKPDTRRIIHFGPAKTMEEYYQQIGRAGRDGLDAHCTMYCNLNDFDSYKGDFYLGNLSPEIRAFQERSIDQLKEFSMNDETCRRAALLRYFGETPEFGDWCGTCDVCQMRKQHADDLERDFAEDGARVLLYAVSALRNPGTTTLEKILNGNTVENFRYNSTSSPEIVREKILEMKGTIKGRKKAVAYFSKELLPLLETKGYIISKRNSMKGQGFNNVWTSYELSSAGRSVLHQGSIILPVPQSVRDFEKQKKEEMEKSLARLKKAGIDTEQIPKTELEEGDGGVMKALNTWMNYLDQLTRNDKTDRVNNLEDLRLRIEAWRDDMAIKFRIAPASVIQEYLLLKVAYTAASLKNGRIERDALVAVGVRSGGIDELAAAINQWLEETQEKKTEGVTDNDDDLKMLFPDEPFSPAAPWKYAVYRPNKKTGLAAWESSYNRFYNGEHPQAIAMSPANGRPIQVATVVGHIFDALTNGRPVNLRMLAAVSSPPTKSMWDKLCEMEATTGMSVVDDPEISGQCGEKFRMIDFAVPEMGNAFALKDFKERTHEETLKYGDLCQNIKWYMVLRRAGYTPKFESTNVPES